MSIADIKKMSFVERVHPMEQIQDTLRDESEQLESPEWYEEILQNRRDAYKQGCVQSYTIERSNKSLDEKLSEKKIHV